jgi:hypothetical protein
MRYLLSLALVALAGCAHAPVPYDQQFSTLDTVDADGVKRAHAWLIGPPKHQEQVQEAGAKK